MIAPPGVWGAGALHGSASGYRLLAGRRAPEVLRWASDPDSPELRELAVGEVRLAIVRLRMGGGVWLGPVEASGGTPAWVPLLALGEGRVVESRDPAVRLDWSVDGLLPISTHVVLDNGSRGEGGRPLALNGRPLRWSSREDAPATRPSPALHRLGIGVVERHVRRRLAGLGWPGGVQGSASVGPGGRSSPFTSVPISVTR